MLTTLGRDALSWVDLWQPTMKKIGSSARRHAHKSRVPPRGRGAFGPQLVAVLGRNSTTNCKTNIFIVQKEEKEQ